jgi:hypothetical protein
MRRGDVGMGMLGLEETAGVMRCMRGGRSAGVTCVLCLLVLCYCVRDALMLLFNVLERLGASERAT